MKNFFLQKSDLFLEYLEKNLNYSPQTIYTYRLNLKEALAYVEIIEEEGRYVIDLMPYRLYLQQKQKRTVYKKISIFKSFVGYLHDNGISVLLRHEESIKIPKTLPKPVEMHYIREALQQCSLEERVLLKVIYGLGLRVSEAANLKLDAISGGWVRIKGKGDKIRQLPLLQTMQYDLDCYRKAFQPERFLFEKSGKRMSENQLRYRIEKIFRKIGIKVTPHQLRHAFATDLLEDGARITDVSALLGHTSLETTQIYTKLNSSMKMRNYQKAHPLCGESDGFTKDD